MNEGKKLMCLFKNKDIMVQYKCCKCFNKKGQCCGNAILSNCLNIQRIKTSKWRSKCSNAGKSFLISNSHLHVTIKVFRGECEITVYQFPEVASDKFIARRFRHPSQCQQ